MAGIQDTFPQIDDGQTLSPQHHDGPNKGAPNYEESKILNTDPTESRTALDKRYGQKELALVNLWYKLASLDTNKGEDYKKVEKLIETRRNRKKQEEAR